ncbi:MAG: GC-type dockerin domain-anchored protein [Phycisphaerales bacterium JB040]
MFHDTVASRFARSAGAAALLACVGHASAFGGGGTNSRDLVSPTEARWAQPGTANDYRTTMLDSGSRPVDVDVWQGNPNPRYSGSMVANDGDYSGYYYVGWAATEADLRDYLANNQASLADIDPHVYNGETRYAFIFEYTPSELFPAERGWDLHQTSSQVASFIANNPDKIPLDIEPYDDNGLTRFSVTWRDATAQEQARQRRFYPMMTRAQILDKIDNHGLRLVDLDTRPHDAFFSATMELDDGAEDWWLHGATQQELDAFIDQHGARVLDLETYGDPNGPTYDALLRPNTNELTQTVNTMMRSTTDGDSGFNQSIGHVERAAIRADAYFEPADSFGLFYLYAAFEEIENGEVDLDDPILYRLGDGDACPDDSGALVLTTYREALRKMMQEGDRQAAHAVLQVVGGTDIQGNLNDRDAIHSYLFHELGCHDGSIQNYTTLDDVDHLGRHYILGWLDDETEHAMLDLMNNDLDTTLAGSVTFQSVLDLALDQSDMTEWDKLRFRSHISLQTVAGTYDDYADPDEGMNTSRFVLHKVPVKLSEPIGSADVGLSFGTSNAFVNDASSVFGAQAAVGLAIARLWRNALDSAIPSWEDNPSPCPADQNADGVLDNGDITAFVENFLAADPDADVNFDGVIDHGDLFLFVHLFTHGCEV